MKFTSLSLVTDNQEALRFDLRNLETHAPFQVKNVVGLDADELIPKFYAFSRNGQKRFYELTTKPRDVSFRVKLNPRFHLDEDHSYLRDQLYRVIAAARDPQVELQFHDGASTVAHAYGFITKFEAPRFTKTPDVQITMRCNDAMFRGVNPTIMDENALGSVNPIVVADSASTAPHGFRMSVTFTATVTEFVIQDKETDPDWSFMVDPPVSFIAGDVLHVSSEHGNKYVYMVRGGVTTHLMDKVDSTSVWPTIFHGFNEFWFPQIASFDWNYIQYDTTHWGI